MTVASIPGFRGLPLSISQLQLSAVLKCGQSFRWHSIPLAQTPSDPSTSTAAELQPDREWRLTLQDRLVCLRQSPTTLFYRSIFPTPAASPAEDETRAESTLTWLQDYFQLDIDLVKLYDEWSAKDAVFKGFRDRFCGIRMLRQDPWENVVSFICSSNNHISRITGMVQSLCTHFSPMVVSMDSESDAPLKYHSFPPPQALKDPSTEAILRELGFGYRAKYIQKTAALLCERHEDPQKWLTGLRTKGVEEARTSLLELSGVGPKVADCILLMSLDKASVVPVDTHVYQIAVKHYGLRGSAAKANMTPALYALVSQKMMNVWGDYAGWAHSVLFTADLKSFADYGLPSPAPSSSSTVVDSPSSTPTKKRKNAQTAASPSPLKRSRFGFGEQPSPGLPGVGEMAEALTLVERIKTRRRTSVKASP